MNRYTRTILTAILLCLATTTIAAPISKERAARVAQHFWVGNQLGQWEGMVDISNRVGINELFVFAKPDGGFVIVSADDRALPILGYSASSIFDTPLGENIDNWLRGYATQIRQLQAHNVEASRKVQSQWMLLDSDNAIEDPVYSPVAPLLTSTWSQGTYYNDLCPTNTSGTHAATGCVATAMAQVMKYWNYPTTGRGSKTYTHPTYGTLTANFANTTYDWQHMPNSLNSLSTQQEVQAVATLMYHAGISLTTNYASTSAGSGADVIARNGINYPCVENAIRQYFDYSPQAFGGRLNGIGEDTWRALLKNDLDSAWPVIYSGFDFSGGHCFVCDGYDSQERFHFNWGWGGMSDGYFAIGNLNPSVGGIGTNNSSTFNIDNMAVFGIRPASRNNPNTSLITATAANTSHGSVSGSGTYTNFTDLVTLTATANSSYRFDHWSDGDRRQPRQFWANGNVNLTAHFLPVSDDTITYCANGYESNTNSKYFGFKVETADLPANQTIRSIMLYNAEEADFTVQIYNGDNYSPGAIAYQETFHLEGNNQWETLRLSQLVPIDNTQPMWVIIYCPNGSFAAPLTSYCGNSNGSWASPNGVVWNDFLDLTYMVKAILSEPTDVTITAIADDPSQGSVTGGGHYALGESCTLTAIPLGDNTFDHWNDGSTDNPRTISASATTTYTAYFSGCGVSTFPHTQDFSQGLGCWTTHSANEANASELYVYNQSSWWGSADYLVFSSRLSADNYNQYLISPRLLANRPIDMVFSYRANGSNTETFEVRYSTTSNSPSSFTHLLRSGSSNISTWDTMHVTIPSDAHYVTINYTTNHGYYFNVDDIQLTAEPLPTYTITVSSESTDMGTVTGGGTFEEGTTITIEATPAPCHEFAHWQDGNTQNPRSVIVTANATYTATFIPIISYGYQSLTACDSAEWNGQWYYETSSSIATTSSTSEGCDSITTLMLTINHSTTTDTNIVATGSYEIDGVTYTESSTITRHLVTLDGCDSTVTIILTINPEVGISDIPEATPTIWAHSNTLNVDGGQGTTIRVVDLQGRIVATVESAPEHWEVLLPHVGAYIVSIDSKITSKIIIK